MKKIICLALAFVMVFSSIYVIAADTEGYEKALKTAKERIGNTDEYDEFSGHVDSREQGTTYHFSWNNDKGGLYVSITDDGIITQYDCYSSDSVEVAISERISKTEAEAKAKELLAVINPLVADSLMLKNCRIAGGRFNFSIVRIENGYMVEGNNGNISIDPKGEGIESFYINYDSDAKFESGEVISEEDAKAAFKEKLGFELKYIAEWNGDDKETARSVYGIKSNFNKYISAVSGEVITLSESDSELYKYENASADMAMAETASGGFTPAELSELEEIEMTISEKEAVNIIKRCKFFKLPKEAFENYGIRTYNIDDENRGYNLSLKWDEEYAEARINGNTGAILSFWKRNSSDEAVYSTEQAEKTAEEAFKALAGDLSKEYRKNDEQVFTAIPYKQGDKPKTAHFSYTRYVNDIPFYNDSINITISLSDNSVTNYDIYYSNLEFPSLDGIVSYDEAAEEYFKKGGFEVIYVYDKDEYKLVYSVLESYATVDALTGKYDDDEIITEYSDVTGHYCEKAVNSLLELGIGFNSSELRPDEPILQKEFAALLKDCVYYSGKLMLDEEYDYTWLYEYNIKGIIENEAERNPDAKVTRLDAAKYTVCAMRYGEIGALDIYRPMFKDMKEAGYASILCGLGIMNGDGYGNFNPTGVLTRAQALIIIYNYLDR